MFFVFLKNFQPQKPSFSDFQPYLWSITRAFSDFRALLLDYVRLGWCNEFLILWEKNFRLKRPNVGQNQDTFFSATFNPTKTTWGVLHFR